ncbi:hypothetical protein V6N13_018740 [Hibiscus sabdariffa]|uniref:Uncharacterized protein n=1 Tax=Hibiscus sabdariffa TaxID=183260 RepID=A0ABR2EL29_9ROSI
MAAGNPSKVSATGVGSRRSTSTDDSSNFMVGRPLDVVVLDGMDTDAEIGREEADSGDKREKGYVPSFKDKLVVGQGSAEGSLIITELDVEVKE